MNVDYEKQESTEALTTEIIKNSLEIMNILNRDDIRLEEVNDYKIYPIADNDIPQLSSDRLEYTLTNGLGSIEEIWGLDDVREVYNNIEVQKNEQGVEELGFKDIKIAEKFVCTMSKLSCLYRRNKTTYSMQLIADIMKKMSQHDLINISDLYNLSERQIIEKIKQCDQYNISQVFSIWENTTEITETDIKPNGKYSVSIGKQKIRYINPLVKLENKYVRIYNISNKAKKDIEKVFNDKIKKYAYLNFDFK